MSDERPDWLIGTGIDDADMSGDPIPGGGAFQRLWIPRGESKKIIFVTGGGEAPILWEHQFNVGGSWQNWVTCVEPFGMPCQLCRWADATSKFRRYKGAFFTVIDCTEFKDKSGKVRKNEKRILCAKKKTTEILKRKRLARVEEGQGLKGAMFNVYRTNDEQSPSVGDDYEFIKMVDLSDLPVDTEPHDFSTMLKPDPDKVAAAVQRLARESGGKFPWESGEGATTAEGTDASVDF